jgi:glycosyltransferase involved in cell wall biosynthesis
LEFSGKSHSLYNILAENPPPGYRIRTKGDISSSMSNSLTKNEFIYSFQEVILNKLIPVTILKSQMEALRKPPRNTDLTYAAGHLILRDEPWVVDLEFYTQLAGYNLHHLNRFRKVVEKALSSNQCKKIICWTNLAKKTITENTSNKEIHDKIEIVRLSTTTRKFTKMSSKDKIKILFVGSSNIPGEFEFKGGIDLLISIKKLNQRYDNLEFTVRSDMPKELKKEFHQISNVIILDQLIPWSQLDQMFQSADIFLFPTHSTPGLVLLDAMSYELPIITSDVWANSEMVIPGENGFLVRANKNVRYTNEKQVPIWTHRTHSNFIQSTRKRDQERIQDIVNKTGLLIEDEKLRKRLGKNGRKMVENGTFSMQKRTQKLKKIFDQATS